MLALIMQPLFAMDQDHSSGDVWSIVERHPVVTLAAGALFIGGAFLLQRKWKKNNLKQVSSDNTVLNTSHVNAPAVVSCLHTPLDVEEKPCINFFLRLMDKPGFNEVHQAAAEGKTHVLAQLLDVDHKKVDQEGPELIIPIMLAAGNGHVEASQLLLERDGLKRPSVGDKRHMTALAYAALYGHMDTTRLLVEYIKTKHSSQFITDQSYMRPTPLHCAISNRHYAVATYLIEEGACLRSKDLRGDTPVHVAVCKNVDPEFMVDLIKKCDDVNMFDRQEYTPLDVAKFYGHVTLEEILQRAGAKTAREMQEHARQEKKEEAWICWLEQEFGSINAVNFEGLTLLDRARRAKLVQSELILLKYGAKTAQELKEIKKREEHT